MVTFHIFLCLTFYFHCNKKLTISSFFPGECHLDTVIFKADEGIFFEGRVMPAVKGVNIRSLHKIDPNVILESTTDANGEFR